MKMQDGILVLEFQDLERCGIPQNTVYSAKWRRSASWQFLEDATDRRRVLIVFESLKESYKALIRTIFGNPYEHVAAQILDQYLTEQGIDTSPIRNFITSDGHRLPEEHQAKYITALRYLHLAANTSKSKAIRMGFPSKEEFFKALCTLINTRGIALAGTPVTLRRKIVEYQSQGPLCLIPQGKYGNTNKLKFTEEQQQFVLGVYSQINKLDSQDVYQSYLIECKQRQWLPVKYTTIKAFLAKPDVKQAALVNRDPKVWRDKYEAKNHLAKPTLRDALWEMDGSRLDLWYKDLGMAIPASDMVIFKVQDSATRYILGVCISWSEDHVAVYMALKRAVSLTNRKPHQILFDPGSANVSSMTTEFLSRICAVSFPTKAKNPNGKSIEKTQDLWQEELRQYKNWSGKNIRAKKEGSYKDLAHVRKVAADAIPERQEAIEQALRAVALWNNKVGANGMSPKQHYESLQSAGRSVELWDIVDLFHLERGPVKYTNYGLQVEIGARQFQYIVVDQDASRAIGRLVPDAKFYAEHVDARFQYKYDPEDLRSVRLYKDGRFITEAHSPDAVARAIYDYKPNERQFINALMKMKDDQKSLAKARQLKAEEVIAGGFELYDKETLARAESDYQTMVLIGNDGEPVYESAGPLVSHDHDTHYIPSDFTEGGNIEI